MPDVNKSVCQGLAVRVDDLDTKNKRDANLIFCDVAAEQDVVQVVRAFLQLGSQRTRSLHAWSWSLQRNTASFGE